MLEKDVVSFKNGTHSIFVFLFIFHFVPGILDTRKLGKRVL